MTSLSNDFTSRDTKSICMTTKNLDIRAKFFDDHHNSNVTRVSLSSVIGNGCLYVPCLYVRLYVPSCHYKLHTQKGQCIVPIFGTARRHHEENQQ